MYVSEIGICVENKQAIHPKQQMDHYIWNTQIPTLGAKQTIASLQAKRRAGVVPLDTNKESKVRLTYSGASKRCQAAVCSYTSSLRSDPHSLNVGPE